jgi:hypothetical protein
MGSDAATAAWLQRLRNRLDSIEYASDTLLVMSEDNTLRQHVGDHQQPFRRHLAEVNDAYGG